jgi:hypothetical protein
MKTYDEWLSAVTDGCAIFAVPPVFRDYNMYDAFTRHRGMLYRVPTTFRDYLLCLAAVSCDGISLEDVPMHMRDYDMCRAAVASSDRALAFVPANLIGREFLEILASSHENI